MATNPLYDATASDARRNVIEYLLRLVTSYLQANVDRALIPDAELQGLHPYLARPLVWARVQKLLGL